MMKTRIRMPAVGTLIGVVGLALGPWAPSVRAQEHAGPENGALRAELRTVSPVYSPDHPVWLRFLLHNASDEPVDIALTQPIAPNDGIALPPELVFGTDAMPSLSVVFEDLAPAAVAVPQTETTADGTRVLRLAPHGSVGGDFDLRRHHQSVRYPGSYRVEWRPLGGKLATAQAEFRVEPRRDAIIVTDYGKVTFELEYDRAPINVANFLELVADGFYDGKTFHRVVPGRVIMGGCPKGDGTGVRPDGKLVPAEFHEAPIDIGTLAMSRKPSDENSASCQFFIALARLEALDDRYTVIGRTHDGESLRTLMQLARVGTDAKQRPDPDLVIRSINLVDATGNRVRRLEMTGGGGGEERE